MKVVGKYNNPFSANIAKGVLEEEGITSYILNENLGIISGAINTDLLAIEVVVEDEFYDAAVKILNTTPIE